MKHRSYIWFRREIYMHAKRRAIQAVRRSVLLYIIEMGSGVDETTVKVCT